MHLDSLELYQFRNLETQAVSFPARVSLLIGENGQGKTSLLEAIYVLSYAKSFRGGLPRDLVSWKAAKPGSGTGVCCRVSAEISAKAGHKRIAYEISSGRRKIKINDNKVHDASQFYGEFAVVEFNPDEINLVKGAPTIRRQFVDRILSMVDPVFVNSLVSFQRALKNRNAELLRLKTHRVTPPFDQETKNRLFSWVGPLVQHGRVVAQRRLDFVNTLDGYFRDNYRKFLLAYGDKPRTEEVCLEYQSEFVSEGMVLSTVELENKYEERLKSDVRQGRTTFGVQSDDLKILFNTGWGLRIARGNASQGQARSLALSLKLAAKEFLSEKIEDSPVVLLDDVESELDQRRKTALYQIIGGWDCQVIITATEQSELLRSTLPTINVFEIQAGLLSQKEASPGALKGSKVSR